MMTLVIGLIAHRLKTVRLLTTVSAQMVLSGSGYAFKTEFWPLIIIALVGTLSPTASDVSVFAPLEQTLLSNAVVPPFGYGICADRRNSGLYRGDQ